MLEQLKLLLSVVDCPECGDKSGAYYTDMGDVCQCRWCFEVEELLGSIQHRHKLLDETLLRLKAFHQGTKMPSDGRGLYLGVGTKDSIRTQDLIDLLEFSLKPQSDEVVRFQNALELLTNATYTIEIRDNVNEAFLDVDGKRYFQDYYGSTYKKGMTHSQARISAIAGLMEDVIAIK